MPHYLPPLAPEPITIYLGLAGGGLLALATIGSRFSQTPKWLLKILLKVGGIAGLFFVVNLLGSSGGTFVEYYLPALFDSPWVAFVAIFVAICLFAIRVFCLPAYAAIEIVGAILTILICAFTQYGTTSQRATALVAATYFLIRGLDNGKNSKLGIYAMNWLRTFGWKRLLAAPILFVGFTLFAILVTKSPPISPPYHTNIKGPPWPASALDCRKPFVVCNENAWREYERLQAGTPKDRAQSYRDATERTEEYHRELKKRRWLFKNSN